MDGEEILPDQKTSRLRTSLLQRERRRRGWSQSKLAEQLGTGQVTVSRWETGLMSPSPYFRQQLMELFGKSLEELGLAETGEEERGDEVISPVWNVPYRRNAFFTGRAHVLSFLHEILQKKRTAALTQAQAISGLGGVGKTQIAIEYAYRYSECYQDVLWVRASSHDVLITDFITLATLLSLTDKQIQEQSIAIRVVKHWLKTHKDWLLILDNVEDLEMISEFLPTHGMGNILITTRLQALGKIAQSIEVEKMERDEGVMFLMRRANIPLSSSSLSYSREVNREQAEKIVEMLDGLPLALDQAGAYIEETGCDFSTYLELYHTSRKSLLQWRGGLPMEHPEPVAATWSLSFKQVEQNSVAADMLRLLVFLNPEAIPEEILMKPVGGLASSLDAVAGNLLEINAAIALLLRYSLLRRDSRTKTLSVHRLVQAVFKDSMNEVQQRFWAENAVRAINNIFPDVAWETWTQCERCLPHVQRCKEYIEEYNFSSPEALRLLHQAANYLSTHARYEDAEKFLQLALVMCERTAGSLSLQEKASILNDSGMLYLTQGKYELAGKYLEDALEIRQRILEHSHPDIATSLYNLALLYHARGKYLDAIKFHSWALELRKNLLGLEHPDVAQSYNGLAELYVLQGKYSEAEEGYSQAKQIQEKVLEPFHPDVAKTLDNIALLYRSQGKYTEAENIYKQALAIQERELGVNHPRFAQTLNNLARLYRAQGIYKEAEPLYIHALKIREDVFGSNHPQVAQSYYSLAKLYTSKGSYLQAEEFAIQALNIQQQQLGEDHPDVAKTFGIIAKVYQGQQQLDQAEEFNIRALRLQERILDANHLRIAFINNNLAEVYQAQGRYDEAEPLIVRSLEIREQILGADHPYMAYSFCNLAENYFSQKDYTKAEATFKQALNIRRQKLVANHPRIASTCEELAKLYFVLDNYDRAEALYREALEIYEHSLGTKHPMVVSSMKNYVVFLKATGRKEKARKLEERINAIKAESINNQI